jgi:hypothetical protein
MTAGLATKRSFKEESKSIGNKKTWAVAPADRGWRMGSGRRPSPHRSAAGPLQGRGAVPSPQPPLEHCKVENVERLQSCNVENQFWKFFFSGSDQCPCHSGPSACGHCVHLFRMVSIGFFSKQCPDLILHSIKGRVGIVRTIGGNDSEHCPPASDNSGDGPTSEPLTGDHVM